jgi:hypothetical protein
MSLDYTRPDWVRRINAMGSAVTDPSHLIGLDADELIDTASRSLGLDDFGPDTWRAPFRMLLDAIEAETRLTTLGRLMTRQEMLRCLQTRLLLAKTRTEHLAIAQERVDSPLVICGPSRSGTTILFELLALHPRLRAPLAWEAIHPVPFAAATDATATDMRPTIAECEQDFWEDVQPEFATIHELRATLPVECVTIMAPEFDAGHWAVAVDTPTWSLTRAGDDPEPAFRYHESLLQVLQHGQPGRRWLLKTPNHLGRLKTLFMVYPGARVIHTHRDPVKTIPSTVSTVAMTRWLRTDHVKLDELAFGIDFAFHSMLTQVLDERTTGAIPAAQIADIHFQDLLRDPTDAIRRAFTALDLEFDDDFASRIRDYVQAKPQGRHGTHRYAPEDWGLRREALREAYRAYTDHYGVELEDTG